jgi:hypothetical protein
MPVQRKRTRKSEIEARTDYVNDGISSAAKPVEKRDETYTLFVYRPNWFVFSQTGGEAVPAPEIPEWNKELALKTLDIREIPFDCTDGNCLGYARKREVAVSPLSPFPYKTLFHEVGHVELGHTAEIECVDGEHTPRNIREAEAESIALICSESLGLEGAAASRAYIQHWYRDGPIPDKSAAKIFAAADRVLRAGRKTLIP